MKRELSLKELAKLIKICKNEGVSSLKYGELQISIGTTENLPMTPKHQARRSAKAEQVTETANLQSQYDLAREISETLHVEDPVAYESMLINGELGEAKENRRTQ